jgi:hypothetical protein
VPSRNSFLKKQEMNFSGTTVEHFGDEQILQNVAPRGDCDADKLESLQGKRFIGR